MAIIDLPDGAEFDRIDWRPIVNVQVNRSQWGNRRSMLDFDNGYMAASVEVEVSTENEDRAWRAFWAKLRGPANTFRLPASECPQHDPFQNAVVISNHANTTVTSLGGGVYRVEKTGGGAGAPDASAVSSVGLTGDFVLRIQMLQTNKEMSVGINDDPLTDNLASSINRAWYFNASAACAPRENDIGAGPAAAYTTAQYRFIRRVGTTITYLVGATADVSVATLVATGTAQAGTVYFDSTLTDLNGKVDVLLTEQVENPTAASGGAAGATTLTLSAAPPLVTRQFATIPLDGGGEQLVELTQDISGNVITFEPPLRAAADIGGTVLTQEPTGLVFIPQSNGPVTRNGVMQWAFEAEEAF